MGTGRTLPSAPRLGVGTSPEITNQSGSPGAKGRYEIPFVPNQVSGFTKLGAPGPIVTGGFKGDGVPGGTGMGLF